MRLINIYNIWRDGRMGDPGRSPVRDESMDSEWTFYPIFTVSIYLIYFVISQIFRTADQNIQFFYSES